MKIVVIGAAPTGLGVAYRLNELKKRAYDEAKDIELTIIEQVGLNFWRITQWRSRDLRKGADFGPDLKT